MYHILDLETFHTLLMPGRLESQMVPGHFKYMLEITDSTSTDKQLKSLGTTCFYLISFPKRSLSEFKMLFLRASR